MQIKTVHVKNFRSILDESLPCDSLTALVGRNGSGKSSFLRALEFFYSPSAAVTVEDFYAQDVSNNIEIAVTYSDLDAQEIDRFSAYMEDDGLTVVRVFSDPQAGKSGTYHGTRLQNPDFVAVRNAGAATAIRGKYAEIRASDKYDSLPSASSAAAVRRALDEWESQNPEHSISMRDDGQFFGFTQVGQGYLGRHTKFIYIPAVRDALEDATERRGSSVTEIMDLVVRNALANRKDVTDFRQRTLDQYKDIMNPQNLTELNDLAVNLSETLQSFVPDASVLLQWSELADISIPMPQAEVKLTEDEYESRVERTGHGLQRAFIITMLQHLDAVRNVGATIQEDSDDLGSTERTSGAAGHLPNLVLAIEEPELYQHPSRQRHLASVLLNLATGEIPGVADKTQVIYATHSPLFVGLDRFDQVRVLHKVTQENGNPKATQLMKADMAAVAHELWEASDRNSGQFTPETLRPRLQALMTPWMGEGFFSDVVVLVEGEDDRSAILGFAKSKDIDFDALGITVIPCFGKPNIDRPLVILRQLGVSVYVVWDGDFGDTGAKPEDNRYLLKLVGEPEEDWPHFVKASSACFKTNLEKTLEDEIGKESFGKLLSEAQQKLGIAKKKHALKNPAIIENVVARASLCGNSSTSLEGIVENVVALKTQS